MVHCCEFEMFERKIYLADFHNGPTASKSTMILKNAFEGLPEAMEPALSRQNQENMPITTDLRTPSGARSYTHCCKHQMQTPHPNRKPPVSADKNRVVGAS
jgi:hypothetical protein